MWRHSTRAILAEELIAGRTDVALYEAWCAAGRRASCNLVMTGRSSLIRLNEGADIDRIRPEEMNRARGRVTDLGRRDCFVINTVSRTARR
jgi:hypothetical protein